MAKKLALLIGNDDYADSRFVGLAVSAADIRGLKAALKHPDIGGFDKVKVLLNASMETLQREIGSLFANKHRDDLLLLYFSGHGTLDRSGYLHLVLKNTPYDQLWGTSVPAYFIKHVMNSSLSRRQVLILDCCYSGAVELGTKGAIGRQAITEATFEVNGYGREILTSSATTQYAWEGCDLYMIHATATGKPNRSSLSQH